MSDQNPSPPPPPPTPISVNVQIPEISSRDWIDWIALGLLVILAGGLIYIVATVALARGTRTSARVAWASISIELVGVLVVGALSYVLPELFPDKTVWSHFGSGYGFVPLVLPVLGLWWLARHRRS